MRRATPINAIPLDRASTVPLQQQLYREVRRLIHGGALPAGRPVPSSRALADDLRVSRNTVIAAYDRLIGEGYLDPRPRSGLFVSPSLGKSGVHATPHRLRSMPVADSAPIRLAEPKPFRPCQPDVRLFPLAIWNRERARRLRAGGDRLLRYHADAALGLIELRVALAAYLGESRGVRCDWRQVAVTSGSQQALFLLAHLLEPGATIAVEDPGYLGARHAWESRSLSVAPIGVDEHGVLPPEQLGDLDPVAIYTTPSRQFPTGACLHVARRLAWLAYARRRNAWVIEDDYDSEYRYGRPPAPSLHSLDTADRVIYVGTMSKVLFPSLRIGYAVLPPTLVDRFAALRAVVDDHGPVVDQATLAGFIESGAFYSHIRRSRRHYAERQAAFCEFARRAALPVEFSHVDGGMNLQGRLPPRTDDVRLARGLSDAGFEIPPVAAYSLRRQPPGLVFGFAAHTVLELQRTVPRVASVVQTLLRTPRRGSAVPR